MMRKRIGLFGLWIIRRLGGYRTVVCNVHFYTNTAIGDYPALIVDRAFNDTGVDDELARFRLHICGGEADCTQPPSDFLCERCGFGRLAPLRDSGEG